MVVLKRINRENFEEFVELNGTSDQNEYVDSNIYSLAEAYKVINNNNNISFIYTIYYYGVMVGFIMAVYLPGDGDILENQDNSYYISKLMINKRYRGRGIGNKARKQFEDLTRREITDQFA